MNNKAVIPAYYLFLLIVHSQFGIGVLSLPFDVYGEARSDGWISILIAGGIIQILLLIYWYLCSKYPGQTLFEISKELLGKTIGTLINMGYTFYFIYISIIILILYASIVKSWIFFVTPKWVLMTLLIITSIYLVRGGLQAIVRFYFLMSIFIFLTVIFVSIAHKAANYHYLFPVGNSGLENILLGSKESVFSMLGFELILFTYPFFQGSDRQKLKLSSLANMCITLLYGYIAITAYVFFSHQEIEIVPEPVLYMMKEYTFIVFERIDLIFLTFWVFLVVTTICGYLYVSTLGVAKILKFRHADVIVPYVSLITLGVALVPMNKLAIENWLELLNDLSVLFLVVIPICLIFLLLIKGERRVNNE